VILFLALCSFGVAIAGLTAFLIFWPLTLIHIRDRYPALALEFGSGAFLKLNCLYWLLTRRFTDFNDRSLSGLANPARLALLVMFAGLIATCVLWLVNKMAF